MRNLKEHCTGLHFYLTWHQAVATRSDQIIPSGDEAEVLSRSGSYKLHSIPCAQYERYASRKFRKIQPKGCWPCCLRTHGHVQRISAATAHYKYGTDLLNMEEKVSTPSHALPTRRNERLPLTQSPISENMCSGHYSSMHRAHRHLVAMIETFVSLLAGFQLNLYPGNA